MADVGVFRPVRDHQHHRQRGSTAPEVAKGVQSGVIRPVGVFDDEHHGRGRRSHQRVDLCDDPLALATFDGEVGYGSTQLDGNVAERPKRPRRQQVITCRGEHPCDAVGRGGERLDEARLADPGLAGDEYYGPPAVAR